MLDFAASDPLTLGAELELQLVDPDTFDLVPRVQGILDGAGSLGGLVKPEIFESMIELITPVCRSAGEAEASLRSTVKVLEPLFERERVRVLASGTHPTALYRDRRLYPSPRYNMLVDRNQWVARRLMIFSLHVHVGMPDAESCIGVLNEMLWNLPALLAASASSPFWQGEDTGLSSSRIAVFEAIPTGGHPCTVADWNAFSLMVDALHRSRSITSLKDLWWDVRPSPGFGTLEIRMLDCPVTLSLTGALVAALQVLAADGLDRIAQGRRRGVPPDWLLRENKWRAARHGLNADFVVDPSGQSEPIRATLRRIIDELAPTADRLGCRTELERLRPLAEGAPTSAARQREVLSRSTSLPAVTESLISEWEADLRR
ncbi:MAG: YbdK family carboxylate-amine ligase [Gemmatimonadales bacterium]